MLGSEHFGSFLRVVTIAGPIGMYFLILGLLNSRRHPQLLTGRQDFSMLILAMSPLPVVPVLNYLGPTPLTLGMVIVLLAAGIRLAAPPKGTWVIYNLPADQARSAIARALRMLRIDAEVHSGVQRIDENGTTMQISEFSLLRNVTIRLTGGTEQFSRRFAAALSRTLGVKEVETSPMAAALLLVATGMLVAPMALLAHRIPEIVRIVSDLLK